MILSRLQLTVEALSKGSVRSALARGAYGHHQLIAGAYGDQETQDDIRLLFRQDGDSPDGIPRFLTLAPEAPTADGSKHFHIENKDFRPRLSSGDQLAFSIRVNPVVSRRGADDKAREKRRGKRVDVIYDTLRQQRATGSDQEDLRTHIAQDTGSAWLIPRLEQAGLADIAKLRCDGYRQHRIRRGGQKEIRFSTLDCQGTATVGDPETLIAAIAAGIGPAKGFGCGLLLIRRA